MNQQQAQAIQDATMAAAKAQELEDYIAKNSGSTLALVRTYCRMYAGWARTWRQQERAAWARYYAS
jgi:hypothetical protein